MNLAKLIGRILMGVAIVLYMTYLFYLPFPELFSAIAIENTGVIFYGLSTAGAAFAAWGFILSRMGPEGVKAVHVLRGSAVGFALMALMRLTTAIFPPALLADALPLLLGECVLFGVVAWKLYASASKA